MGDVSAPLRWIRETDKRIEDLEHWSPESLTKASLNLNERVKTLESERHDEGNERREMKASLLNQIETRRCETNELKKRIEVLEKRPRIERHWHEGDLLFLPSKFGKPKPHTCGECKRPFFRSDFGLCRSHPVVKKSCQPIAIWREHEACENFKGEA